MTLARRLLFSSFGGAYTRLDRAEMLSADNGGWSAAQQSGFYYNGKTFFGTVDPVSGDVQVGQYVHATDTLTLTTVHTYSPDQHNRPTVVRRGDGKLVTVYSDHAAAALYCRVSTNADDATAWGAETNIDSQVQGVAYTYAKLMYLPLEDGDLLLFYRSTDGGTVTWHTSRSVDGGSTWTNGNNSTLFGGTWWYGNCFLSSDGRIDYAFTDGAYAEHYASLYHFYYEPGYYRKSDGTDITALAPFTGSEVTKVYDGASAGAGYPTSVVRTTDGGLAISYSRHTGTPQGSPGIIADDADYRYAYWNGSSWSNHDIVTGVGVQTVSYSVGSCAIDPSDPSRVLASVRDGNSDWQMYLKETTDNGASWSTRQLTTDTDDDIYPSWIEGHDPSLQALWLDGTFTTEDDWSAGIESLVGY
jgi:hypothetical protein